jgi:hypothetical protein
MAVMFFNCTFCSTKLVISDILSILIPLIYIFTLPKNLSYESYRLYAITNYMFNDCL